MTNENTLRRGLAVIEALGKHSPADGEGLSITAISEVTRESRSSVSRTLKTLRELSFVERNLETQRYTLGWKVYAVGNAAKRSAIAYVGFANLKALCKWTGEHIHLSVLQGTEVLVLQAHNSEGVLQARMWAGQTVPARQCASGFALLSQHSRPQVWSLLDLPPSSSRHLDGEQITREVIWKHCQTASRDGVISVEDGLEIGLAGIAAPVRSGSGSVVAALGCVGLDSRLKPREKEISQRLVEEARRIGAAIGPHSDGATGPRNAPQITQ